jgi:hypothetical protein
LKVASWEVISLLELQLDFELLREFERDSISDEIVVDRVVEPFWPVLEPFHMNLYDIKEIQKALVTKLMSICP